MAASGQAGSRRALLWEEAVLKAWVWGWLSGREEGCILKSGDRLPRRTRKLPPEGRTFVKPSHKGCKVRLFSGYHHPSPIIDWGGRWCTVLLSPVCLLPLFYPATPAPTLELSAATRASPTKLFAAHCLRAPFGCALLAERLPLLGVSRLETHPSALALESHRLKRCDDQRCSLDSNNNGMGAA